MTQPLLYALAGMALFALALHAVLTRRHLVRRIIALNIMGSGVFLVFGAGAIRGGGPVDPVPHALVITGIVVAVAMTALALVLLVRLHRATGQTTLEPAPDGATAGDGREDGQ